MHRGLALLGGLALVLSALLLDLAHAQALVAEQRQRIVDRADLVVAPRRGEFDIEPALVEQFQRRGDLPERRGHAAARDDVDHDGQAERDQHEGAVHDQRPQRGGVAFLQVRRAGRDRGIADSDDRVEAGIGRIRPFLAAQAERLRRNEVLVGLVAHRHVFAEEPFVHCRDRAVDRGRRGRLGEDRIDLLPGEADAGAPVGDVETFFGLDRLAGSEQCAFTAGIFAHQGGEEFHVVECRDLRIERRTAAASRPARRR